MTAADGQDRLARLWAPWRSAYVAGEQAAEPSEPGQPTGACVLCALGATAPDRQRASLVVARGSAAYVVLNAYPYNPGHVMIVPYRHVDRLEDLTEDEADEVWRLTRLSVVVVTSAMQADGANLGMNLGKAGGAGIADHLHQHVVPRWAGDTNFITTAGASTRVLPQALEEVYDRLEPAYRRLSDGQR